MIRPRYAAHRLFLTWNDDYVTPLTLRTVRWLTVIAFAGYAVSRVLERTYPGTFVGEFIASLIGLVAIGSMLLAFTSRAQRLLTEEGLDEYQRSRRDVALTRAYTILSGLVVITGCYAMVAADLAQPLSLSNEALADFGAGALMLATLLPVTILVWTIDPSEDPEAPELGDERP